MNKMKEGLKTLEAKGSAGAGLVEVTLNGEYQVISIHIDPSIITEGDSSTMETLLLSAFNDSSKKMKEKIEEFSRSAILSGGLGK